jgi:hypothetical protein
MSKVIMTAHLPTLYCYVMDIIALKSAKPETNNKNPWIYYGQNKCRFFPAWLIIRVTHVTLHQMMSMNMTGCLGMYSLGKHPSICRSICHKLALNSVHSQLDGFTIIYFIQKKNKVPDQSKMVTLVLLSNQSVNVSLCSAAEPCKIASICNTTINYLYHVHYAIAR